MSAVYGLWHHRRTDARDVAKSKEGYEPFGDEEDWVEAGVLSESSTISAGGSIYGGVGLFNGDPVTKSMSIGVNVAYSHSKTDGEATYIDINGDGLPDKVFRMPGGLEMYYQPNLSGSTDAGTVSGVPVEIEGISGFSKVKSNSWTAGTSENFGFGVATVSGGISETWTWTNTTDYFSDVNSDGLPDLVSDGTVYFNHIEKDAQGNPKPVFTQSSADTPSPIKGGCVIDISGSEVDP